MTRCVDHSVWVNGEKLQWSEVGLWTHTHRGDLRRLRHWKDVRDVELAALEDGTVWNHRVVKLERDAGREQAAATLRAGAGVSYLDDRAARGKRPAMPVGIDGEFLTHVDVIGDLHGCRFTLRELATSLGYDEQWRHSEGRRLVLLGDFADKNLVPQHNAETVRLVCSLLATGRAVAVMGNHDRKLLRSVRAVREAVTALERHAKNPKFREQPKLSESVYQALRNDGVTSEEAVRHGLRAAAAWMRANSPRSGIDLTLRDIAEARDAESLCQMVQEVYGTLEHQLLLDGGTVIAVHAAARRDLVGAKTRKAREYSMFGDLAPGDGVLPERRDWTAKWDDERVVVYGHEIQSDGVRVSGVRQNAFGLDTGAYEAGAVDGFRGLSALRWPEQQVVGVVTSPGDVLRGEELARRFRDAVVQASTRSVVTKTTDHSVREALCRPEVRALADTLEDRGVAAWVRRSSFSQEELEVLVCASDAVVAGVVADVAADAVAGGIAGVAAAPSSAKLRVTALGECSVIEDAWLGEVVNVERSAVSLWGDEVGGAENEVRVIGDARIALRNDPTLAVRLLESSAVAGIPLSKEVVFHLRTMAPGLGVGPETVAELAVGLAEPARRRLVRLANLLGITAPAE
jgi:hypothetical protein